jgi:thioredoxin 1
VSDTATCLFGDSLSGVREITDETFEAEVLQAGKPVVIDFWAPWCGPCKAVEPVLADLAEKHAGRVEFAKLNIDENPVVASRYGVLAIPTAILFEAGEARETVVGARSRSHYEEAWAPWLSPTSATP